MIVSRTLAAVALVAGLFGGTPPRAAEPVSARAEIVLRRYFVALEKLAPPPYVSYEYSIEQGGGTNISQVHRIYRAGRDVRDEALQENGRRLRRPRIQIRHDGVDRYALAAVAPTAARYTFAFTGVAKNGEHLAYTFRTEAKTAASFTIEEVTLDGASCLPTVLRFRTTAAGVQGHGTFFYAKADRYWMIREARVDAAYKDEPIGERIAWDAYRFPSSLPSATFADTIADPEPISSLAPRLGTRPDPRLAPSPSLRLGPKPAPRPAPSHRPRHGAKPPLNFNPSPLLDFSPSPSLRFSPSPELRFSPSPELRFSPSPELRFSPSPELHFSPSPVFHFSPKPAVHFSPKPAVRFSPKPAVRFSPKPAVRFSPKPAVRFSPKPAVHFSPSPVLNFSPSPALDFSPSPALDFTPSPALDFTPSPVLRPVAKPVVRATPSPVASHTAVPGPPEPDF
jgi:hypothetical protein